MKRNVVILCVMAVLMLIGGSAVAWRPTGWVYHTGDYAYSMGDAEWYYFNVADTQWRVNLVSTVWDELTDATGWNYYQLPYAYSIDTGAWHWFNTGDIQWCIGLTSRQWSKFGQSSVPAGMALIPAGSFSMGDSFAEGESVELPVHTVYVGAFYMDKYEVTKAKWDEVATWASSHGYDITAAGGSGKAANHPVQEMTWYECVKWCNARSEKEGRTVCYTVGGNVYKIERNMPDCNWSANGYRLPTEAEWEKAARGGLSGKRFPWGANINHDYANYKANGSVYSYDTSQYTSDKYHPDYDDGSEPYTSPVGAFASNGYGLYDMSGNVLEWCNDWYGDYTSASQTNPKGPNSGSYRLLRGGAWYTSATYLRCAYRYYASPSRSSDLRGFRCAGGL